MIDKTQLLEQTEAYIKAHPPNTGYTLNAMKAVLDADLPDGTNIGVQFALQFDGKETIDDEVQWDSAERRLPYGDDPSLDDKSDCSSFWRNVILIFFPYLDIGTWTEAIWKKYKTHQVPWEQRRPLDLILYNFKSGRNVSHVSGYIGNSRILHTTSTSNPLRVDADSYARSKVVGVVRVLTDEEYYSLIIGGVESEETDVIQKGDEGIAVEAWQTALVKVGMELPKYGIDSDFGSETETATKAFQTKYGLEVTGIVNSETQAEMTMLLAAGGQGRR